MPAVVLIGAQWGDEGKGKATDALGSRIDYVVKFNGGNNAGHTVVVGDEKYALHLLDRKSTRLNSSHVAISYAVFCLKKKMNKLSEDYIIFWYAHVLHES